MTIDLDHVAIATDSVGPTLNTIVGELGAPVIFGGTNVGFRAMQVEAGDLRIELLEPFDVETNDFLRRFLDRGGEGPHHLTFKTDDIRRELQRIEAAGYRPVGVNLEIPMWQEAFIHPSEGGGTVVQIAQSAFDAADFEQHAGEVGPGRWWPEPPEPAPSRAILRRAVITTDEMARAVGLYADLLEGERADFGDGWVELRWPGGGCIRLEHAAGREQGIDRLEWTHDGPPVDLIVGGTSFVLLPG